MGTNDIEGQQSRLNNGANAEPTGLLSRTEKRYIHLKLYQAALDGDWDIAKDIYENYQGQINYNDVITLRKDTALHIAVAAGNLRFVQNLLRRLSNEDLALENVQNIAAFFLATFSGKVELAMAMMKKTEDLAMTRDPLGSLPIYAAAFMGRRKMVRFFYDATKHQLGYVDKKDLLISLIGVDMYDIAKEMLTETKELAIDRYRDDETVLHVLAQKSSKSTNNTPLRQTGLWSKAGPS